MSRFFRYRARDRTGGLRTGVMEAVNREAALERLLLERWFVDTLEPTAPPPPRKDPAPPPVEGATPRRSGARPQHRRLVKIALALGAVLGFGVASLQWRAVPSISGQDRPLTVVVEGILTAPPPALRFDFPELPLTVERPWPQIRVSERQYRMELRLRSTRTPTYCEISPGRRRIPLDGEPLRGRDPG
ncbi:MAG: hypothetical protein HY319_13520 [Armatimonadetes bacterium]|nr:hypothetical protein [Armatimonadota bacterium]